MKKLLFLIPVLTLALKPSLVSQTKITDNSYKLSSSNGEFCGSITYGEGTSEFVPIERFTLKDKSGHLRYELTQFGSTLVDISNNGSVVGIDFSGPVSNKATLHFYSPAGIQVGTASVGSLLERSFSTDGSVYCVNDGTSGLCVFDPAGNELHNVGRGNWFAVSADGKMIALAQDNSLLIFNEGKPAGSIALASPFIRQMRFSPDGTRLSFVDRKNLVVYSTAESRMLLNYRENNSQLNFISCDVNAGNNLVVAGLEEDKGRGTIDRRTRGYIYLFDATGKLAWKGQVRYSNWSAFIPDTRFTSDHSFQVKTVDEVYEYKFQGR